MTLKIMYDGLKASLNLNPNQIVALLKNQKRLEQYNLKIIRNIGSIIGVKYYTKYKKDLIPEILETYEIQENKVLDEIFNFDYYIFEKPKKVKCEICKRYITERSMPFHKATHIKDDDFIQVDSAFRRKVITFQHNCSSERDIEIYMSKMKERGINLLKRFLGMYKNMKVYLEL